MENFIVETWKNDIKKNFLQSPGVASCGNVVDEAGGI